MNRGDSAVSNNRTSYHRGSKFRVQKFRVWKSEGLGAGPRLVAELVSLVEQETDGEAEKTRTKELSTRLYHENIGLSA